MDQGGPGRGTPEGGLQAIGLSGRREAIREAHARRARPPPPGPVSPSAMEKTLEEVSARALGGMCAHNRHVTNSSLPAWA